MNSEFPEIYHRFRTRQGLAWGPCVKSYFERLNLLRGWYDREEADVQLSAHAGQPLPIGTLLEEVTASLQEPETADFCLIAEQWSGIVGPALIRFIRPLRLEGQVLLAEVRHPALLRELTPSLGLYLERLHALLGKETVTEIKLTASGEGERWV